MVSFERETAPAPDYRSAVAAVTAHWRNYWTSGGAIDFSGSTDPRAAELERRIVLSQYLAAINEAGEVPPQEEGLFSNSWNGKFHLEVHPIHAAHFAAWGRPELLERSLAWYLADLSRARAEAVRHGVEGAWWTKMSGPEGRNSPSTINPFIMWQQPAPIYMAELVWRDRHDRETLDKYGDMVDQTARLLASGRAGMKPAIAMSLAHRSSVQENHPPLTTVNPAYELEFFRWGLITAQAWRERRGLPREPAWDRMIAGLAAPAQADGLYLPVETAPNSGATPLRLRAAATPSAPCLNRDHPSFLMAFGPIAGRIDREAMRRTLRGRGALGPAPDLGLGLSLIAMTAARSASRDAVDWLLRDLPNNHWGVSGMTPRVHLEAERQLIGPAGAGRNVGPDGPGFRRAAETYFPSNGSLLLAAGMMAAGWDGSNGLAPGFPRRGWRVRAEGIRPLP